MDVYYMELTLSNNRHLAEWRLSRFTFIVTVHPKICNVKVIGMNSPPLGWCDQSAYRIWQHPVPFRGQGYFIAFILFCQHARRRADHILTLCAVIIV